MPTPPTTFLKLHRDDPDEFASGKPVPTNFKFPVQSRGGGSSATMTRSIGPRRHHPLVAGRVEHSPLEGNDFDPHAPERRTFSTTLANSANPNCVGRIVTSTELIREIESTLDRMHDRLKDFRHQIDDAFKFPSGEDDPDRPRAA